MKASKNKDLVLIAQDSAGQNHRNIHKETKVAENHAIGLISPENRSHFFDLPLIISMS
jgi:hypothetical protein